MPSTSRQGEGARWGNPRRKQLLLLGLGGQSLSATVPDFGSGEGKNKTTTEEREIIKKENGKGREEQKTD